MYKDSLRTPYGLTKKKVQKPRPKYQQNRKSARISDFTSNFKVALELVLEFWTYLGYFKKKLGWK